MRYARNCPTARRSRMTGLQFFCWPRGKTTTRGRRDMATGFVVSGRGDLDALFKARTTAAGSNTGFLVGAQDLAQTFQDIAYTPAFTPVTHTYTSGTGSTETVPAGATSCVITVHGGGGGGGMKLSATGGGGGGGSRVIKTVAVSGGQTFTYTVGTNAAGAPTQGSSGTAGRASTVTSASPAINLNAGGGGPGTFTPTGGAGGTATGGDTNTSGVAGLATGQGGASASGAAGGTGDGGSGVIPGGGGAGGIANGSGAGGVGVRGLITFANT